MTVSVAIITKNEASFIARCLRSAAWADEIIVVDSGSNDRTVAIARAHGARVIAHPWQGFGAQKNWAFQQCAGDWIISLDADETLSPELAEEIRTVIASDAPHSAYRMLRRNYYNTCLMHCWWPDWQQRLFKKGRAWFETTPVHERLVVDGSTGKLSRYLHHQAVGNLDEYLAKFNRYTDAEAGILRDLRRQHAWKSSFAMQGLARPLKTFLEYYLWRQGFRDGLPGLYVSLFSAAYRFVAAVKASAPPARQQGMA